MMITSTYAFRSISNHRLQGAFRGSQAYTRRKKQLHSACGYLCILLLARPVVAFCPIFTHKQNDITGTGSDFQPYRRFSSFEKVGVKDSIQESKSSSQVSDDEDLPDRIEAAYQSGETDGILKLARDLPLENEVPEDLVSATIRASGGNKGQAVSILNSWIGACILVEDPSLGAGLAWDLLSVFDDVSGEQDISPDLVTLSLAYTALRRGHQTSEMAEDVLERAMKLSKKLGGSKRRKSLAASRRQTVVVNAKDVEEKLQSLYGSDFQILQETEDFVVLLKPSGMVCFHKHRTTAGKIKKKKGKSPRENAIDISLEDALLDQKVPLSTLNHEGRGLVHRIDRGTSGCIVLAKTDDMHARLLSEFFLRRVKKSYRALVSADKSIPNEGLVEIPVTGRPAKSSFKVIERYNSLASLLEIATFTGRKHQVRVHCAEGLGAPILNFFARLFQMDPIYSGEQDTSYLPDAVLDLVDSEQQRFFLHASSLAIPQYGIQAEAPSPVMWEEVIAKLKEEAAKAS